MSIPAKLNHTDDIVERLESHDTRLQHLVSTLVGHYPVNGPEKSPFPDAPATPSLLERHAQLNRRGSAALDRIESSLDALTECVVDSGTKVAADRPRG